MDKAECVLQFVNYLVDKIEFINNREYDKDETELILKFKHNIKEDDKEPKKYYVNLTMNFYDKEERELKDCPFQLNISLTGTFKLSNYEGMEDDMIDKLVNENTITILFPYLRSLITSITANANINPLILPPVNILKLLENEKNNDK